MTKKIILTGGGTAGHVNPNIALLPGLKERGYEIYYIGSHNGIEKRLVKDAGVAYFAISTGKLRRYIDAKNFTDVFRVVKGVGEAKSILKKLSPNIIFSKGGFVSVPVVLAASQLKIPVIIHESDSTPGLANRISFRFTKKICASFPETMELLPESKRVLTGTPIRAELSQGNPENGKSFCGFTDNKPIVTFMGGSIGAVAINNVLRESLDDILSRYNCIHLCGKGNLDESLMDKDGYAQFEYIGSNLKDLFAATDIIVSRSGANAIFEILSLRKPNILIPLPGNASRGDQILNAESFEKNGFSKVLLQENLTKDSLLSTIEEVFGNKDEYISNMENGTLSDSVNTILNLIDEVSLQDNSATK